MVDIINRNSILNFFLIFLSISLGILWTPFCLLIWPVALAIDDLFYYSLGLSIFDSQIRIRTGYQFGHIFVDDVTNDGRDLGFNFYDGDLTKSQKQSQIDKWDFMLDKLKLKPGDSLIDIGCGYGDWLNYAKSKGIQVTGVNISPEQSKTAREQFGIEVICTNWKDIFKKEDLQKKLFGKFDAVTFMDTVEHYVSIHHRYNMAMQEKTYTAMFELASKLLKKDAATKRVFISCLHWIKPLKTFREKFSIYLLDRYHSGFYPFSDEGLTKYSKDHFKEIARFDKTEDYRLTSVLDHKHFGSPHITWNLKRLLYIPVLLLTDPHHIHKWIDIATDTWMWWHFGNDAYRLSYDNEYQKQRRRVTLWWLVLEHV